MQFAARRGDHPDGVAGVWRDPRREEHHFEHNAAPSRSGSRERTAHQSVTSKFYLDNSFRAFEPLALIVLRVAWHTGSGIVGGISQRVRPFGVIRQCVVGYARIRVT
jgi:hypothetical protein